MIWDYNYFKVVPFRITVIFEYVCVYMCCVYLYMFVYIGVVLETRGSNWFSLPTCDFRGLYLDLWALTHRALTHWGPYTPGPHPLGPYLPVPLHTGPYPLGPYLPVPLPTGPLSPGPLPPEPLYTGGPYPLCHFAVLRLKIFLILKAFLLNVFIT